MNHIKHLLSILSVTVAGISMLAGNVLAQDSANPYKILNITQTNGTGGIDYPIETMQFSDSAV
jgi:hypothetical protein